MADFSASFPDSGTDTGVGTVTETETDLDLDSPWQVIIYNDPVNLMNYVTMIIQKVFGYSREKARNMMLDVHEKGRCIVWMGNREKAEFFAQQLQSHQLLAAIEKLDD